MPCVINNSPKKSRAIARTLLDSHRPHSLADALRYHMAGDPEGDAQDVHRFSMRQGCFIEKSRLRLSRQV
jgi:hypothetical protein